MKPLTWGHIHVGRVFPEDLKELMTMVENRKGCGDDDIFSFKVDSHSFFSYFCSVWLDYFFLARTNSKAHFMLVNNKETKNIIKPFGRMELTKRIELNKGTDFFPATLKLFQG